MKQRWLLFGRKIMTDQDKILKCRDLTLAIKTRIIKSTLLNSGAREMIENIMDYKKNKSFIVD